MLSQGLSFHSVPTQKGISISVDFEITVVLVKLRSIRQSFCGPTNRDNSLVSCYQCVRK